MKHFLFLLSAGICWQGVASAQVDSRLQCEIRSSLVSQPRWVTGVAGVGSDKILVSDTLENTLLLYELTGALKADLSAALLAAGKLTPISVHSSGTKLWVSTLGSGIFSLDDNLRMGSLVPLSTKGIGSVYDWTATADKLVGFGSVLNAKKKDGFELGLLRAPLTGAGSVELVAPAVDDGSLYLLGNNYFTSVGDAAYFLTFDTKVRLNRLGPTEKKPVVIADLPAPFGVTPKFATIPAGPSDAEKFFAEVQETTMAVSLLSVENKIILLGRVFDRSTMRTTWSVQTLDLSVPKPRFAHPKIVAIDSAHASAATAGDHLIILPRGEVKGLYSQKIEGICAIPLASVFSQ